MLRHIISTKSIERRRFIPVICAVLLVGVALGVALFVRPAGAASDTQTFTASADTNVFSGAKTSNYGSATALFVTIVPYRILVNFDTSSLSSSSDITSAQLRLYSDNSTTSGGLQIHPSSTAWNENTVTWNTQPTWNTTVLATSVKPTTNTWVTIDIPVSAITKGGTTGFGISYSTSGTRSKIASRETAYAPQLVVTYASTPTQQAPGVTTGSATNVTNTSATLTGTANDNGGATTCQFDYGTTTTYGQTTSVQTVAAGSGQTTLSAAISGLTAGSTYNYRLECTNASGTTYGDNAPFTTATTPPAGKITKVLWIMEENTSEQALMSDSNVPYIKQLANTYGLLANFHNESKPSMPNYIAAISGSTYGLKDDAGPSSHKLSGTTLFGQLPAGQAMSFAETMPSNCDTSNGPATDTNMAGSYAVRHTGWPYFVDSSERTLCNKYQVNLQNNFQSALNNGLPAFTQVAPAICNDFHPLPSSSTGCNFNSQTGSSLDARANWWLQTWVPKIMAGPDYQAGNLAIFITWDEGSGGGSSLGMNCTTSSLEACHPPMIVVSPYTHSVTSNTHYTHYDMLRTTEELLGIHTYLGNAAQANSFANEFGL